MSKPGTHPKPDRGPGNFVVKDHMELWHRLAAVKNMHGAQGERKKKRG